MNDKVMPTVFRVLSGILIFFALNDVRSDMKAAQVGALLAIAFAVLACSYRKQE